MNRLQRAFIGSLTLLTLAQGSQATEDPLPSTDITPDAVDRIRRIETGLIPPLHLKGQTLTPRRLEEAMTESGIPALAVAVVDDCEVIWSRGWGTVGTTPVTGTTPFQVGSVSKTVTATVALTMAAEGELDLDRPIDELLTSWVLPENEFETDNPVRVRHLLNNSAGLTRTAYWFDRKNPLPPLAAILQGEAGNPKIEVEGTPGARVIPSNSGYLVLQNVLEEVSGQSLAALAQESLFAPLGMSASAFEPVDESFLERGATNHDREGSAMEGKAPLIPGAPGGLWSSAKDLAHLLAELMRSWQGRSGFLLPRDLTRRMLSPTLGDMGLGMHIRGSGKTLSVQQAGGGIGSQARIIGYPELCQGAAIVLNTDRGRRVIAETLAAIGNEYDWPDLPLQVERRQVSPSKLYDYEGRYAYDASPSATMTFSVEGTTLFAQSGERKPFPLIAVAEPVFVSPGSSIEFRFDALTDFATPGVTIGTAGLYGSHLTRVEPLDE